MKKIVYILTVGVAFILMATSCAKDFLERVPQSNYTGESFYTSDEAVLKACEPLYNRAWFNFNRRAMWYIGSLRANDAWNPYMGAEYARFQTTALSDEVIQAWSSLYTVVTMSNSIIYDLQNNVGSDVTEAVKNQALGEAFLMRGAAYFYMVRIWGDVILFENNNEVVLDPLRPLNPEKDVLKFIIRDFTSASELLPERGSNGRPSRYAAMGMKAKALLARSGWDNGGTRDEADLAECIRLCEEVIDKGGYSLINYEDLFKPQHNDNAETLLAMKWASPLSGGWGEMNAILSDISFSDVCDVNCWGGNLSPSLDMVMLYNQEPKDKIRLKATFFYEDAYYDYIKSASGGYTYDKKWLQVKKGVVGSKEDVGGELASMASPLNTYIMRYADVLLVHAEASLGNSTSLTGGRGLESLNMVRGRAGLDPKTSVTFEDIMGERRKEFAMEYCNWYDFFTWYRWKPEYMLDFLNNKQYRNVEYRKDDVEINDDGTIRIHPYDYNDAQGNRHYTDGLYDKNGNLIQGVSDGYVFDIFGLMEENDVVRITVTDVNIFLPYPESEVLQNPLLNESPQPYDFGEEAE